MGKTQRKAPPLYDCQKCAPGVPLGSCGALVGHIWMVHRLPEVSGPEDEAKYRAALKADICDRTGCIPEPCKPERCGLCGGALEVRNA